MERARAAIENGSLPCEPVKVRRRAVQSHLALCLGNGILACRCTQYEREDIERLRVPVCATIGLDDAIARVAEPLLDASLYLVHRHRFILRMSNTIGEFVLHRSNQ